MDKYEEDEIKKKIKKCRVERNKHIKEIVSLWASFDPEAWLWCVGCMKVFKVNRLLVKKSTHVCPFCSDFHIWSYAEAKKAVLETVHEEWPEEHLLQDGQELIPI